MAKLNNMTVKLKSTLLATAFFACSLGSAHAEGVAGAASGGNSDVAETFEYELEIEIPKELFYFLWPGYIDSLIKQMSSESIEYSPLLESANFGRTLRTDELSELTPRNSSVISTSDKAYQNDLVTSASDQTSYPSNLGLITSADDRMLDDSYVISPGGIRMLDSIKVCAAPALNSAFTSLVNCDCSVQPIDAAESVNLKEGTALIVADRDMEVAVNVGKLKVAEGSVVLVSTTPTGTSVFDFHDPGKNSVMLTVAGRSLAISPGRHLHATSQKTSDFASVNSLPHIPHRRLTCNTTDGGTVFVSEFSTLSAMEAVEPLKKVLTLKHPEARKLANQMLKTSAVLLQLGGSSSEDFKHHFKPKMTALVGGAAANN